MRRRLGLCVWILGLGSACSKPQHPPNTDMDRVQLERDDARDLFCYAASSAQSVTGIHLAYARSAHRASEASVREACLHRVAELRQAAGVLQGYALPGPTAARAGRVKFEVISSVPLIEAAHQIEARCGVDKLEAIEPVVAARTAEIDAAFERQLKACGERGFRSQGDGARDEGQQ